MNSLQEDKAGLLQKIQSYQEECQEYEVVLASTADRLTHLEAIAQSLSDDAKRFERERNSAFAEEQETKNENERVSQQLEDLKKQQQALHIQNKQLRGLITKGVNEPIDDNTVKNNFGKLREQIQRIVFKFYPTGPGSKLETKYINDQSQRFFRAWQTSRSDTDLSYRVRSKMFQILHEKILCRLVFGLRDFGKSELECGLAQFEQLLTDSHKSKFKCTSETYFF